MKIVINRCWGGFGLSQQAYEFLGLEWDGYGYANIERNNHNLIKCVEELGDSASGRFARLEIVDIPEDVEWEIEEYDGMETVREVSRSWC